MWAVAIIALDASVGAEEDEHFFLAMIGSNTWDNYLFNFKMPLIHTLPLFQYIHANAFTIEIIRTSCFEYPIAFVH